MKKIIQFMAVTTVALALVGCSNFTPKKTSRGNLPSATEIAKISIGSDREQVLEIFGPPLSTVAYDENTWLYMKRHTQSYAFFKPEITEYQLLALRFADGKVTHIEKRTVNDLREIPTIEDKTASAAPEPSWLDEVLGNIGRFNKNKK